MTPSPELKKLKLRYSCPEEAGYTRKRMGKGFAYFDADGVRVTDSALRERFDHLGIPPAYKDVWICAEDHGHLQAIAVDARGRKQYIYHADFVAHQEERKFQHMAAFAQALPKIRKRVTEDLARLELDEKKVLAAIVQLMETTLIRVGNERYARDNKSFGATTLRKRHVKVTGNGLSLSFVGKSGIARNLTVEHPMLRKIIRQLQDLPGQRLFMYRDVNGEMRTIYSQDVNAYLQNIAGADITAKDFRTWNATVQAANLLCACEQVGTVRGIKSNLVQAVKEVATLLGNTPTVCRKSYIHPRLLETYLKEGRLPLPEKVLAPRGLRSGERRVLAFLAAA